METNILYCDNNLNILKKIPDGSIDLIYIDPPFFTKKDFVKFNDKWDDIKAYIVFMRDRIIEGHRVLKDTGSIFLHCDWHANHHLRLLLDEVFGANNFLNEIIWCYKSGGASKKHYSRKHDNIYFYAKNHQITHFFASKEKSYLSHKYGYKGWVEFEDHKGWYRLSYPKDWWDEFLINRLGAGATSSEWPTQKPLGLLDKIIKATTKKGDIVLDFFCGSGSTCVSAQSLFRKFIGIDISPEAIKIAKNRLNNLYGKLK